MEYVVSEERRTLPNGARVQSSVYPKEQMDFNRWAREMNVSGSYIPKPEPNRAMEMLREWGVNRLGSM